MANQIMKVFKVYGVDGHRQSESFHKSFQFVGYDGKIVSILNSDVTGTNEYSIIAISANSEEEIRKELNGQISDGAFENSRVGRIEEIGGDDNEKRI